MQTITTNFRGRKITINQHFPEPGSHAGGACFEIAGDLPGSGDCYLGAVMAAATGEPLMFREPAGSDDFWSHEADPLPTPDMEINWAEMNDYWGD